MRLRERVQIYHELDDETDADSMRAGRVESNSARCDSFWRYSVDAVSEVDKVKSFLEKTVEDMNKKVGELPTRGPWSKFIIDDPKDPNGEKIVGKLSIEWGEHLLTGITCI